MKYGVCNWIFGDESLAETAARLAGFGYDGLELKGDLELYDPTDVKAILGDHGLAVLSLTADGKLRPCLLSDYEIDLRTPLRQGASAEDIKALIIKGIRNKPERHHLSDQVIPQGRTMSEIGG